MLQGQARTAIACKLGVGKTTVSRDVAVLAERLRASRELPAVRRPGLILELALTPGVLN